MLPPGEVEPDQEHAEIAEKQWQDVISLQREMGYLRMKYPGIYLGFIHWWLLSGTPHEKNELYESVTQESAKKPW